MLNTLTKRDLFNEQSNETIQNYFEERNERMGIKSADTYSPYGEEYCEAFDFAIPEILFAK